MTQRYVRSLVSHKEREIYLGGLFVIAGFKQIPMVVEKHSRGSTTYTLRSKLKDAVNGILSFSNKPLVFIFYLGTLILCVTGPSLLYLIIKRLYSGSPLIGWTSLMMSIWFLGGLIIFMLGILGMYLSKIFVETKNRPYVIVRQIHQRKSEESTNGGFEESEKHSVTDSHIII